MTKNVDVETERGRGTSRRPSGGEQARRVFHAELDNVGANIRIRDLSLRPDLLFEQALEQTRMAVCLTDPRQKDNPIIFTNKAFEAMTGYKREEIVGQNCRFLQGDSTDDDERERLRQAIREERTCVVELLNYKKDGTPFWNSLHVGPIYDSDGKLLLYYGSQWDVTNEVEERERNQRLRIISRELNHRLGNIFAVIGSILRMSRRSHESGSVKAFEDAEARIAALSRAHKETIDVQYLIDESAHAIGLRELVDTVIEPYRSATTANRITADGPDLRVEEKAVSPIGLILHELATNALKYGALSVNDGSIRIVWSVLDDDRLDLRWLENSGSTSGAPTHRGGGSRLMDALANSLGTDIDRDWSEDGLTVRFTLPSTFYRLV